MKRLFASTMAVAFAIVSLSAPAGAVTYNISQKTLSPFSGQITALSSKQKAEIKSAVENNLDAEKFICTGIRYESDPASVNIMVRARAKAACAYAKELNPSLSTWYQNKPTKAKSYAGKVLLTVKSLKGAPSSTQIQTDAVVMPYERYVEGDSCKGAIYGWEVLGYLKNGDPAYLICERMEVFAKSSRLPAIDPDTFKPIVSSIVPNKSTMAMSPFLYIKPVVSEEQPKSLLAQSSSYSNYKPCRLTEADYQGRPHMASGFPIPAERAAMDAEIIVQVIPVDFADGRAAKTTTPSKALRDATQAVSDFWSRMTDGNTQIKWRIPDDYLHLPNASGDYGLGGRFPNFDGAKYSQYVKVAAELADPNVDFSGVDIILIHYAPETPAGAVGTYVAEAGMPTSPLIAHTNEGVIFNTLIQGGDYPRDITNWVHEFGHMLGVTDSGDTGMSFGVMNWYGVPELTFWNRYVLGAEKETQMHCITDTSASNHLLSPVAWPSQKIEGVVIPLSETRAIVAESRRRTGYDALLGKESEGVLVYQVDTTKSGNGGNKPFTIISPPRMTLTNGMWSYDSPLKLGESVNHEGWNIKVLETGSFGDVISVWKD